MTTRVNLGPETFRALANPLRVNMLGLLRVEGPSTATRLAQRLDVSSGLASYHLRALADAGFIAEDLKLGNGRDRWWRAAHDVTSWDADEIAVDPPTAAMVDVWRANWIAMRGRAEAQFEASRHDWPAAWRRAADYTDLFFRLTPEELAELQLQVMAVLDPWLQTSLARRDGHEPMPEAASAVLWFHTAVPVANIAEVIGTAEPTTKDHP